VTSECVTATSSIGCGVSRGLDRVRSVLLLSVLTYNLLGALVIALPVLLPSTA
jgi:hypothetical protein